jgi:hypothetical protein
MMPPQPSQNTHNFPSKPEVPEKVDTEVDTTPSATVFQHPIDPDLASIIAAWPSLLDAVKQAILLLVTKMRG